MIGYDEALRPIAQSSKAEQPSCKQTAERGFTCIVAWQVAKVGSYSSC